MKIRVLLVDNDINYVTEVKQYFGSNFSIDVCGICSSKKDFIDFKGNYDVLILNMLLDGSEAFEILDHVQDLNKKVIVTSEFISSEMMKSLNIYKPNYFIKKPVSLETIEKVIKDVAKTNSVVDGDSELKIDITNLLHSLGIPSHIKGYNYIRDGVRMIVKDSSLLGSITKQIYPSIADNYDTTSSRVERAIRHAIEVSWIRGDYNLMEELFGNSIDFDRSKPTNSEFIATLADRLVLNKNYV